MNRDSVQTAISFVVALVLITAIGAGALLLTGRHSCGEALLIGFCVAIVGVFAPIVVALIKRLSCKKR